VSVNDLVHDVVAVALAVALDDGRVRADDVATQRRRKSYSWRVGLPMMFARYQSGRR
jgi:hypothetical protein